jgi:hypothetical protein
MDDVRRCDGCACNDVGGARRRREAPAGQRLRDDDVRRTGWEAARKCGKARNRYDTGDVYEMAPAAQVVRPGSYIAQSSERGASRRCSTGTW